ncbi:SRS domain-containing protein [Neospora caninum Liverpool]|uniref:SRS domain-containing protein n=1 Tax=Neospora caninum (strain Liverpool) TaxID=572307 RepID=F0VEM4_NEOCL|nr:SRS domain-containing protein [Neospora caninum Liverpool]CBZ52168.1 SRS domain-containing protein [Neospora caninum Liverpool]CEL66134.1 TPA: SRS domain-containing protein [Neospora caninum Liverpool]|eukprot:XP_003882200.1 SRS domain-containing protein [Neospora caninum Liverpool]
MASSRRELTMLSEICKSIALLILISATWSMRLSSGKSWSHTISKDIRQNETKTGIIEPGETVSVVNTSGRDLLYLPPGDTEVYNVASDVCQTTIPTRLSTLFSTSDNLEWVETGHTRTLVIPSDVVPEKVTVQFCFQVLDPKKNKRLTTIIKVAGAKSLSTALSLFLGLPLLVATVVFMS